MRKLVAAIDQGTTSTRCMLFDHEKMVASAQLDHRQFYPQPGWVEHDAEEIWTQTCAVITSAMQRAGVTDAAREIACVGIANQRETCLAWNRRTGVLYGPAIVWQDIRGQELCETLAAEGSASGKANAGRFRAETGLPLSPYFSASKMHWMLRHVPGLRADAEAGRACLGTIDSFLLWRLTAGPGADAAAARFATDITNASRTLLMNLHTLRWDENMCAAFEIPRAALAEISASSHPSAFATTHKDGPFGATIPITGILGDQQAALVGQACFLPGECKNTYGTGCFLLLNTGETPVASTAGLLTTPAYQFPGQPAAYALEGSIAMAGALVQWLRDNLGFISNSQEIETLAATVADCGDVYVVPAFSGLLAPYWRADARGVMVGLTRYTTKAHIARAALEATAFQTRDVLDAMAKDLAATQGDGAILRALKVDGGMTGNELLMQFQADILGIPVVRPRIAETTALGAAYAAGLALGHWGSTDARRSNWKQERHWQPRFAPDQRERLQARWRQAVERSLGWAQ